MRQPLFKNLEEDKIMYQCTFHILLTKGAVQRENKYIAVHNGAWQASVASGENLLPQKNIKMQKGFMKYGQVGIRST